MNEMDTRFANQFNIQWFPGHMTKTLRMMEQEIQHVDASLVLLDARIPLSSLNPEIERITARKPKLYALNKADLADPAVTEEWIRYFRAADAGCVAISAKQKGGTTAVKNAKPHRPAAPLPGGAAPAGGRSDLQLRDAGGPEAADMRHRTLLPRRPSRRGRVASDQRPAGIRRSPGAGGRSPRRRRAENGPDAGRRADGRRGSPERRGRTDGPHRPGRDRKRGIQPLLCRKITDFAENVFRSPHSAFY